MYFAYFKNNEHKKLFISLKQEAGQGDDCEYTSALYTLSSIGKSVQNYVEPGGAIKIRELKKDSAAWSSSEKALVKLAFSLFGAGARSVSIDDVFRSLDEENCRVALQALEIRYLMR